MNSAPEIYRSLLRAAVDAVGNKPEEERLLFLKSWNEWAEGNHLEPDLRYGTAYLQALSDVPVELTLSDRTRGALRLVSDVFPR